MNVPNGIAPPPGVSGGQAAALPPALQCEPPPAAVLPVREAVPSALEPFFRNETVPCTSIFSATMMPGALPLKTKLLPVGTLSECRKNTDVCASPHFLARTAEAPQLTVIASVLKVISELVQSPPP